MNNIETLVARKNAEKLAIAAGDGAAQRAANRGWDFAEQSRCYDEAYAAAMEDLGWA